MHDVSAPILAHHRMPRYAANSHKSTDITRASGARRRAEQVSLSNVNDGAGLPTLPGLREGSGVLHPSISA